jgi:tRNA A-37 threonylcarbamoyl transferase component Bud32
MSASVPCAACGRTLSEDAITCPWDGTPAQRGDALAGGRSIPPTLGAIANGTRPNKLEPTAVDSMIGRHLGDYVVRERLGQGGMGIVYSGEQPMIGKRVAIKVLRPEIARDPEQVQRLLSEARAVNAIRHRGIIDIFNLGQLDDGRSYVVMEYLHGQALDELIAQRGSLAPVEALEILDEVLAALGAGHEAGIIHRDLKPSNIYLVRQPDGSRYVKLLDFGLAKQSLVPRGATPQTRTDMFVGTPEYVAPEQARAEPVGPYTDLYAAGVVAFEMLTGKLPFEASAAIDFVLKHLEAIPPAPSSAAKGIPVELDALVLRMLQKEPRHRPASCEAVRREIARIRRALSSSSTHVMQSPPWQVGSGEVPEVAAPVAFVDRAASRVAALAAVRRVGTPLWIGVGVAGAALLAAGIAVLVPGAEVSPRPARSDDATPARSDDATPARSDGAAPAGTAMQPAPAETSGRRGEALAPPARRAEPTDVAPKPASPAPGSAAVPQARVASGAPRSAAAHTLKDTSLPETASRSGARAPSDAPDLAELLRRIDRLESLLRSPASGEGGTDLGLALLAGYRTKAQNAGSADERRDLARTLQKFEQRFIVGHRDPEPR